VSKIAQKTPPPFKNARPPITKSIGLVLQKSLNFLSLRAVKIPKLPVWLEYVIGLIIFGVIGWCFFAHFFGTQDQANQATVAFIGMMILVVPFCLIFYPPWKKKKP
jgi:hypothetical protein